MGQVGWVCAQLVTRKWVGFHRSIFCWVGISFEWSRNPSKTTEKRWNLARSSQIWWKVRQIRWFFHQIALRISKSGVYLPNLTVLVAEISQIKLKNSMGSLRIHQNLMVFGWVGFHEFWRRGLKIDLSELGFVAQDLRPTPRAIELGGGGLGTGGWVGGLDSPNANREKIKYNAWRKKNHFHILFLCYFLILQVQREKLISLLFISFS